MAKKRTNKKTTVKYTEENAPVVYESLNEDGSISTIESHPDGSVIETDKEDSLGVGEVDTAEKKENSVSASFGESTVSKFPDSYLNSLVRVKLIGRKDGKNGYKMMSPLIIAKTVLDTSKTYVITTSDQIALGVEKIIKEECKLLLNLDIPDAVKEYAIGRFKADIERYGF